MPGPLLSVVIPVHDAAPWIGELLDSVLDQDVEAMEVLVVDDRSSDGSAAIIDTFRARDARVQRLRSDAPGGAAARNTGAAAARGEYLVFADADDLVPPGAYRAMVGSLEASGSDLVIGDHLKFSPTRTWSPTARWHAFDHAVQGTTLAETPALLTGRACWNRLFRRSFWERAALGFPNVGHADDIEPMTRSVVEARAIDVITTCVYLYRERAGGAGGSMSNQVDEAALLDYLREETACATLVRAASPAVVRQQSLLVLDADGWVHLDRYFASVPSGSPMPGGVEQSLDRLLDELDAAVLDDVAAERRCFFALLWAGQPDAASDFAAAMRARESEPERFLREWVSATAVLLDSVAPAGLDRPALVDDGLLTALLHAADRIDAPGLAPLVAAVERVVRRAPTGPGGSELLGATRRAVLSADPEAVRLISLLRHHAPVVVDQVTPSVDALRVEGPAPSPSLSSSMRLVLRSGDQVRTVDLDGAGPRWLGRIPADGGPDAAGRWTVTAGFRLSTIDVEVPVVTARMPLPPLDARHVLQPLSNRRDGWRFLVDHRAPRSVLSRVRSAAERLRRSRT